MNSPFVRRQVFAACRAAVREVCRAWGMRANNRRLPAVRSITPYPRFLAVQQLGQNVAVVNIGRFQLV
jgi:hypothetical protein